MQTSNHLWQQLATYGANAPRSLVVAYIKALADEAMQLPSQERKGRGDNVPGSPNVMSPGETIASSLIIAIAQQEWIDPDREPQLENILAIAGQLDMEVADARLWQEFIDAADALK